MNAELTQHIQTIAQYLNIAHHINGRIRFKIDASILKNPEVKALDAELILKELGSIRGVKSIQINKLARSCTLEYEPATIPPQAWEDLLAQKPSDNANILFKIIEEKYSEYQREL